MGGGGGGGGGGSDFEDTKATPTFISSLIVL